MSHPIVGQSTDKIQINEIDDRVPSTDEVDDIQQHPSSQHGETQVDTENGKHRAEYSKNCPCQKCPIVKRQELYNAGEGEIFALLDNPIVGSLAEKATRIAKRVACQNHLKPYSLVFEKAAMFLANPDDFLGNGQCNNQDPIKSHTKEQERGHGHERVSNALGDSDTTHQGWNNQWRPSEIERAALINEPYLKFWDQPLPFRSTCFMLFTAAVVQGWNQTGTNGANICYLDPLISGGSQPEIGSVCNSSTIYLLKYGTIGAAPFLFAPIGSLLADFLNELLLGRRRAIIVSSFVILSSAIASAFMQSWWQLFVCRIFLGIGMGAKATIVPVFIAEIAPENIRGSLVMNWQVFDALGVFLGFTANLFATFADPANIWRWQVGSSAIPSFALLMAALFFIPWDSPRFLLARDAKFYRRYKQKKNLDKLQSGADIKTDIFMNEQGDSSSESPRIGKDLRQRSFLSRLVHFDFRPSLDLTYRSRAYDTMVLLRGHPILAAKELLYTHIQLTIKRLIEENQDPNGDVNFGIKPQSYLGHVKDFWSPHHKYLKRELVAAVTIMAAQQFCGINILIFYSTRLFSSADEGSARYGIQLKPVWLSWAIGLANVLFVLPAYRWIVSQGRRWLALTTLPMLSVTLGIAAAFFRLTDHTARQTLVGIFTILFTAIYATGMGPVPFTLSAEVFPLEHRMVGMSLAVMVNFFLGGCFALIAPLIDNEDILLGIFAGTGLIAWALVYLFVREPEAEPAEHQSSSGAVHQEAIYRIYEPCFKVHFEFQSMNNPQALLSVRDFFFFWSDGKGERMYFANWYADNYDADGKRRRRSQHSTDTVNETASEIR